MLLVLSAFFGVGSVVRHTKSNSMKTFAGKVMNQLTLHGYENSDLQRGSFFWVILYFVMAAPLCKYVVSNF